MFASSAIMFSTFLSKTTFTYMIFTMSPMSADSCLCQQAPASILRNTASFIHASSGVSCRPGWLVPSATCCGMSWNIIVIFLSIFVACWYWCELSFSSCLRRFCLHCSLRLCFHSSRLSIWFSKSCWIDSFRGPSASSWIRAQGPTVSATPDARIYWTSLALSARLEMHLWKVRRPAYCIANVGSSCTGTNSAKVNKGDME